MTNQQVSGSVVSVGASNLQRRIVNVQDGVNETEAVNVRQSWYSFAMTLLAVSRRILIAIS